MIRLIVLGGGALLIAAPFMPDVAGILVCIAVSLLLVVVGGFFWLTDNWTWSGED